MVGFLTLTAQSLLARRQAYDEMLCASGTVTVREPAEL
jgi:hypothetical protein